jgi:tRNA A37 threonylcarbamoyladenosine modification protein TsaB
MILVIDVSERQKESVYLFGTEKRQALSSGFLLSLIDQILKENNLLPGNLEGLVVLLGQGRFTSARTAVIIANTFAYVHAIPLAVGHSEELSEESQVREKLRFSVSKYLLPSYYAEPNITKSNNI